MNSWFSWRLASLMVLMVLLMLAMAEPVTSQSRSNRNNTLIRYYCSQYNDISARYFFSNLSSTLSSLRQQLSVKGVHYAVAGARNLVNGESIWGLASCRGYVSTANCVSCFDYAIAQLRVCGRGNGANVFYDDCDVRYENYNFYEESNIRAGVVICGNTTAPQQSEFRKTIDGLISDLRTATPRTSDLYAASTRKIHDNNTTIYAIAQCNLNLSQSVCENCLNSRYISLLFCLPTTNGRAIDNGCFMRYSSTPFFGLNQTTNIIPFLSDGETRNSNKKKIIIGGVVGGVCFLLLVIACFLWRCRSKRTTVIKQ